MCIKIILVLFYTSIYGIGVSICLYLSLSTYVRTYVRRFFFNFTYRINMNECLYVRSYIRDFITESDLALFCFWRQLQAICRGLLLKLRTYVRKS